MGSDGNIYIGSDDGYVYALSTNGAVHWEYATGGPIRSSAAFQSGGVVYIGSDDSYLYAFKASGDETRHTFLDLTLYAEYK